MSQQQPEEQHPVEVPPGEDADAIREAMRAEWDANHADVYAHRGIDASAR